MTPKELKEELELVMSNHIQDSLLILGESGIGKSCIVRQVAEKFDHEVTDVRWGQMAPADVRGVPVPNHETKVTEFYPPAFWPRRGPGLIFLDEFNMATPAMMGLGQQLLLDRCFGDYRVPEGVLVWAAGNRKIDAAAVNQVPGPVQNRVAHYEVEHDLWAWKVWAFASGISPSILGFLDHRSELLHKPSRESMAWPSPRTWTMADVRLKAKMSIAPVVGQDVCDEFDAYMLLRESMPNVDLIEKGAGQHVPFPEEPSVKYALVAEMVARSIQSWQQYANCVRWTIAKATKEPEWVSVLVQDAMRLLAANDRPKQRQYLANLANFPDIRRFVADQVAAGGLV